MFKRIFIISLAFLLVNCKKNEINCDKKFDNLYNKRYSLWFHFESNGTTSYDNFTEERYKKLRKEVNDSLQITIDCALENDKRNEILYLYKMKQLYLCDKLVDVNPFFNTINRKIVKDDIYFQLSLYNLLCRELLTKQRPIEEYKTLLKSYSPKLNPVYKDRAIEEFLSFLIDNDVENFKKKLLNKYKDSISLDFQDNRQFIIKDIMMRGDNLVFD